MHLRPLNRLHCDPNRDIAKASPEPDRAVLHAGNVAAVPAAADLNSQVLPGGKAEPGEGGIHLLVRNVPRARAAEGLRPVRQADSGPVQYDQAQAAN